MRTLARSLGGILAVGGAAEGIREVVSAAAEHQAAFARLEQVTRNVGAATNLYGQSLEHLLEREARVKGFSDEQLAQGFLRILAATHDSAKAYRDLGLAQDVSAATGKDLTVTALALAKAEQGSVTSLSRMGIVVPAVTTAVSALTHQHDRLAASGVKFTKGQEDAYKVQLTAAKATDDLSRRTLALTLISERYGGVAARVARTTAAGQYRVLQQELHQVEVQIGNELLPTLVRSASGFSHWLERVRESGDAGRETAQVMHTVGAGLHVVATAAQVVGPPLGLIARALVAIANNPIAGEVAGWGLAFLALNSGVGMAIGGLGRLLAVLPRVAVAEEAIVVTANPFTAITVGALGAIGVLEHFIGEARRAQDAEDEAISHVGTKRAEALSYYAERVKRFEREGMDAVHARARAETDTWNHLHERIKEAGRAADDLRKTGAAATSPAHNLQAELRAERIQLQAINANIATTRTSLTTATTDLRLAEQSLADAIYQGNQQIQQSISSAESNLTSIGDTLSSTIETFLQAIGRLGSPATDPHSSTFRRLREEIASGSAAPGAARAAAEVANQIQESQAVATQTDAAGRTRVQRQFQDLTDQFNRGAISLASFNRRVAGLLAANHISYRRAGSVLGVAFADGFRAQVRGLLEQAHAISATPASRRAGITGLEPNIVRPLDTIHQVQEQVAAAQRARDEKSLEVQKDTRRLATLEAAHARVLQQHAGTQTQLQRQIERHTRVSADAARRAERRQEREARQQAARDARDPSRQRTQTAHQARDIALAGGP
jgi:hypothetical protein